MLPDGNVLPRRTYDAKQMLSAIGLKKERIHACVNDCILFRKEYVSLNECPICNTACYKKGGSVSVKVMYYFSLISRLRRMYKSADYAKHLTWHADERIKDGKLRHPADARQWKNFDAMYPEFAQEPRNLRFVLSADGMNPHGVQSTSHSTWPVVMTVYNLPPWLCMKRKYMMLSMIISGPKQPGNDIDVYLAPLVEDLKLLWEEGVQVYDGFRKENLNLRGMLFGTVNDFPAHENMKDELEKEPPARQRMMVWKAARVDKFAKIVEEDVQRIVDEGDSIAETLTSDEILSRGPDDILAKAIKKEYHRRVLTVGSGVTKKGYFGKRQDTSSNVEIEQLKRVVSQMEKQLQMLGSRFEVPRARDEFHTNLSHGPTSEKGSCPATTSTSLQNKISVDRSKEKSIAISITPKAMKKPAYPRACDLDSVACYHICMAYTMNNNRFDSISVLMLDIFWGTGFTDHVGIENIREVLKLGWLSATSISIYIKYLCDAHLVDDEDSNIRDSEIKCSFTSPHIAAVHTHIVNALQNHEGQDHLVMIPYNIEHHWVLVAINNMNENVYYMDPLRVHHTHPEHLRLEHMIRSAMNSYRANKKGSGSSGRRLIKQVQWYDIECPKQDLIRGYCAYYVCLFIEDILESGATTIPAAYIQKRRYNTFSDESIEHVRQEWCGYFYNRHLKDVIHS